MFSLDDRAGNVLTTVALLVVAAAIVYLARGAFFILLLSILFAYFLDPAVTWVQQHVWLATKSRAWAIAQVYIEGLARGNGNGILGNIHGLNAAQLPRVQAF